MGPGLRKEPTQCGGERGGEMGFGRGEGGEKWEPDRREGSATTEMVSAMGTSYPRHCVTARVTLRSSGQHLLREYWHAHIGIPCADALACAGAGEKAGSREKANNLAEYVC